MQPLREVLLWLDADPARFWSLAWVCFGLTAWAEWRAPAENPPAAGRPNLTIA